MNIEEVKFFIKKDFIGYPVDILKATYINGKKVKGDYDCPKRLGKSLNFNTLEEILNYRICKCNKKTCEPNELLWQLVSNKIDKQIKEIQC